MNLNCRCLLRLCTIYQSVINSFSDIQTKPNSPKIGTQNVSLYLVIELKRGSDHVSF